MVFSVSTGALADLRDSDAGYTCGELIEAKGGSTTVEGPILESEGLAVHQQSSEAED